MTHREGRITHKMYTSYIRVILGNRNLTDYQKAHFIKKMGKRVK